jgi:hypothetical protein
MRLSSPDGWSWPGGVPFHIAVNTAGGAGPAKVIVEHAARPTPG